MATNRDLADAIAGVKTITARVAKEAADIRAAKTAEKDAAQVRLDEMRDGRSPGQ